MLACVGGLLRGGSWAFEPKLDGWRVAVHIGDGVRVLSRPGRDISDSLPALGGLAEAVPIGTVLDGELVSGSGGADSFYRLAADLAAADRRRRPLTFVAFDVLALAGERVTAMPYAERRELLVGLGLAGPAWCTIPSWTEVAADELLAACESLDVEGVVAKSTASPYRPGRRSPEWGKLKTTSWRRRHAPRRRPRLPSL